MVDFNTNLHLPLSIGSDNNPRLARGVEKRKTISPENIASGITNKNSATFTNAFYGDGPYSLEHPNNTTEFVAQCVDYLA